MLPPKPDLERQKKNLLGRIPLVIGVSGHRDLKEADEPLLREEVARVFDRLKRDYLEGHLNTPIVVLSALAEGADSLVAEVALECGATLIAPLPMAESEYREDFKPGKALRAGAQDRLTALLERAIAKIEMPYRKDSSQALVQSDPEKRNDQYQDVGLYIVTHCHVLIALWNGDESEQTGGTSQIVRFKRHGIPYELSDNASIALDGSEIGPVIEIMTPRSKAGSPQVKIETRDWGFDLTGTPLRGWHRFRRGVADWIRIFFGKHPEDHQSDPAVRAWNIFRATTNQTRRFNREAAAREASSDGQKAFEKSLKGLFTDYADAGASARRAKRGSIEPPPHDASPVHFDMTQSGAVAIAERWCHIYQRADALALMWQGEFKNDWFKLFTAGFIAILFFEAYAHICDLALLLMLYIATLVYGFYLFIRAHLRFHQERFLDYRALAEALRVAVYWKVAHIGKHVARAYPIKQPSELAWVKIAVRTFDMLEDALGVPLTAPDRRALDDIRQLWLVGQWAYFTGKSRQLNLHAEKHEKWSLAALGLSPLVGAIGLGVLFFVVTDEHHRELVRHGMIVVMGVLVGLGAVIAGYTEQLAFKAQGRQYERMSLLFERALLLVNKALDAHPGGITQAEIDQIQALYVELGREAMKENAEWVAIYRQRPIRPAG
jgi:hypothetical protein